MQKVMMNMPDAPEGMEWTGYTEKWDDDMKNISGDYMRVLCKLKRIHKEPELVKFLNDDLRWCDMCDCDDKVISLFEKDHFDIEGKKYDAMEILMSTGDKAMAYGKYNDGPTPSADEVV